MSDMGFVLVTGAGGFIGHHLVSRLKTAGRRVRGVDLKHPQFEPTRADEFVIADLRDPAQSLETIHGATEVFALAANMGGIGFIETHKAEIVRDNTLITLNTLEASRKVRVRRLLYASSACVYPGYRQAHPQAGLLKEEDAYPADAEDGYGWEKLYGERIVHHYREDFGLETRVVRFHNIYGPLGTFDGGREKSPAAICRKIALAKNGEEIEVWGDGRQTRSYCYIDDCIEGLVRIMRSDYQEPINLGTDRSVTIDGLVDIVAGIAKKRVEKRHDPSKPKGVRGRNCDTSLLRKTTGWVPEVTLEEGLTRTYEWILSQLGQRSMALVSGGGGRG